MIAILGFIALLPVQLSLLNFTIAKAIALNILLFFYRFRTLVHNLFSVLLSLRLSLPTIAKVIVVALSLSLKGDAMGNRKKFNIATALK